MKWFDSYKYKPAYGTAIFIWDRVDNKQVFLNVFHDKDQWINTPPSVRASFPCWAYAFEGNEPEEITNE